MSLRAASRLGPGGHRRVQGRSREVAVPAGNRRCRAWEVWIGRLAEGEGALSITAPTPSHGALMTRALHRTEPSMITVETVSAPPWAHEVLTRGKRDFVGNAWVPLLELFAQFRADQARSCAYKLRNSGEAAR